MEALPSTKLEEIQQDIINQLKANEEALLSIREIKAPITERWQALLEMIIPIQLDALGKHGLEQTQEQLTAFNKQFMKASAQDPMLHQLNEGRWIYLFDRAFDLQDVQEITLEAARDLIGDIASAMESEAFLSKIDELVEKFADDQDLLERRKQIITLLVPLHMAVMEHHGFVGDDGYVEAQRVILDYYHDPFIMERVNNAQDTLFKRAKLI